MLLFYVFFFLMIRRPPRSTLFPTRRSSDLRREAEFGDVRASFIGLEDLLRNKRATGRQTDLSKRSEEHTSELQSHLNLVCRLLLEKKKNVRRTTLLRRTYKGHAEH